MSDKELNINIRTTADTSGADQTAEDGSIEGVWRFDNCFGTTVIYHFLSNFELSFSSSCFH